MRLNVHAGHGPDGKTACGAIGLIKESTENRKVKDFVISMLKAQGHTVYDCTCENGVSKTDILQKIVAKCNANAVDLDVSIHFNAGGGHGTEVLVYGTSSKAIPYASNTAMAISKNGFTNRGVKYRPDLYVLKHTKSPAMLIECCFVDSAEDVSKYNAESMAKAIVKGITGQDVVGQVVQTQTQTQTPSGKLYKVQCGAYSVKANAEALANELKTKGYNPIIVEV